MTTSWRGLIVGLVIALGLQLGPGVVPAHAATAISMPATIVALPDSGFVPLAAYDSAPEITGLAGTDEVVVTLSVTLGELKLSASSGVTVMPGYPAFDAAGTELAVKGQVDDLNTALAALLYATPDTDGVTDTIDVEVFPQASGVSFNPANGHYYKVSNTSGGWEAARDDAAGTTAVGLTGYLTTVSSAEENAFVQQVLASAAVDGVWLGGNDSTVEGTWAWVTGPEAGTAFWQGQVDGSPVDGRYVNWSPGEPNDAFGAEDFLLMATSGKWNDYTSSGAPKNGMIEFGSPSQTPTDYAAASTTVKVQLGTVTYHANNGTAQTTTQTGTLAAQPAPLASNPFSFADHTFVNWNTATDGSGTAYTNGQEYDFLADLDLYAQWQAVVPVPPVVPTPSPAEPSSQRPLEHCVKPVRSLSRHAIKRITRPNCTTNGDQRVGTRLRPPVARGDVSAARLKCLRGNTLRPAKPLPSRYGKGFRYCESGAMVLISGGLARTYRLTWSAPRTDDYTAYRKTVTVRVK